MFLLSGKNSFGDNLEIGSWQRSKYRNPTCSAEGGNKFKTPKQNPKQRIR
jgi:hypothetical protein